MWVRVKAETRRPIYIALCYFLPSTSHYASPKGQSPYMKLGKDIWEFSRDGDVILRDFNARTGHPQTFLYNTSEEMLSELDVSDMGLAKYSQDEEHVGGSQWTGEYTLDFSLLRDFYESEAKAERSVQAQNDEEARFSFIKGSYVEEKVKMLSDYETDSSKSISLAREAERALQIQSGNNSELSARPEAQSGVEYFALRSFQGLQLNNEQTPVQHYAVGQKGRAATYSSEPAEQMG
ncbi:hypothetical protein L7F22_069349 [Adiantum nelumboides]|nr:hypothetical protein [Adiantum nelumboides]